MVRWRIATGFAGDHGAVNDWPELLPAWVAQRLGERPRAPPLVPLGVLLADGVKGRDRRRARLVLTTLVAAHGSSPRFWSSRRHSSSCACHNASTSAAHPVAPSTF